MTARPRNRDHIRVSDADRERAVEFLKATFVQGRLSKDELSARTGRALTSRTYGELTATTAGIPPAPPAPKPPARPAPARPAPAPPRPRSRKRSGKKIAGWSACVLLTPGLAAAFLTPYGGFVVLIVLTFIGATLTAAPPSAFRKYPYP